MFGRDCGYAHGEQELVLPGKLRPSEKAVRALRNYIRLQSPDFNKKS